MPAYITWSDATERYYQLTKVNTAVNVDSAYIFAAQQRLDSYLATHFPVPFSSTNLTVKDLMIDMVYMLAGNLKFSDMQAFKEDLYARMGRLKSGEEVMLYEDGSTLSSIGGTLASTTSGYHPVFGMGDIEDFQVDSSQLYDEEQERQT